MNLIIIIISFVCTGAAGVPPATHYAGDPNAAAVAAMYSRGAAPGDVMFTALFKNMRTLKFKSCLRNCTAVNHNHDHKQQTLKHRSTQNGSKSTNHKSQTLTS